MRRRHGAGDGSRRKWSTEITRCPLAFFWEVWRSSPSSSATDSCIGTEDSGEGASQPNVSASGNCLVLLDFCVLDGTALHARPAKQASRGARVFGHAFSHTRDSATASVQHGHPATQTAKA